MADIYSRRFQNFHPSILGATKDLMKGWKDLNEVGRWLQMDKWLLEASAIYGMEKPALAFDPDAGAGYYRIAHNPRRHNEIHMAYPSIITLIHEFRHAMQHLLKLEQIDPDKEIDARAWSLSLYRKVSPRTYRRLIEEGMVLHV